MSDFPIFSISPHDPSVKDLLAPLPANRIPLPKEVHLAGNPELLQKLPHRGLAIVGTRNPQARTVNLIQRWIQTLRGQDLVIVSGFARGIDRVAHEAALSVGLPTVAVLGSGLMIDYPSGHRQLREKIIETGSLILSEFPSYALPLAHQFLERNRLIACLASAVIIVDAEIRSGAMNTAKWARDLGRKCFTVPTFPTDSTLSGNLLLLNRDWAQPLFGPHDLGSVWLELSALKDSLPSHTIAGSDIETLVQQIEERSGRQTGASVLEILQWSAAEGWAPKRFFNALQFALDRQKVIDRNGILHVNP